ncbi:MAG: SAM-dependent methyltransferase [Acidobacteria bacterium]|nr:SAM-dependent methyltransferase [Acidobacteriota bacterium]
MTLAEVSVRSAIREQGAISFETFMDIALYHPECGYYASGPGFGSRGDFHTIAHLDPLFGEILADHFASLLERGTWTASVGVLELGAGSGLLAREIVKAMDRRHPDLNRHIRYWIDEISPVLRNAQREILAGRSNVAWRRLEEWAPGSFHGVVFSNELFDALPCHRVVRRGTGWRELFVDLRDGELAWIEGEPGASLDSELRAAADPLPEGTVLEISTRTRKLMRDLGSRIAAGWVVTIDYGTEREGLWSRSSGEGSLRGFYRHQLYDDPFHRVGEQDLTYNVDFTSLSEAGDEAGLETVQMQTLGGFLESAGVRDRVARVMAETDPALMAARSASLKHLLVPGSLTEHFKVLIQRKRLQPEGSPPLPV